MVKVCIQGPKKEKNVPVRTGFPYLKDFLVCFCTYSTQHIHLLYCCRCLSAYKLPGKKGASPWR